MSRLFKPGDLYVYDSKYVRGVYEHQLVKIESFDFINGSLNVTKNGEPKLYRVSNLLWDIMIKYDPEKHK